MQNQNTIQAILDEPIILAREIGFSRLEPINNKWMLDMIYSEQDETLLGHRNSYKTTCLSFAIAFIMVIMPEKTIMFMRKTDDDVKEIIEQVKKILESEPMQTFAIMIYGKPFTILRANANELHTSLSVSPKGAVQLRGYGTIRMPTGKHVDIIFTDDIVNLKDRVSHAERERIKRLYMELQNIKDLEGGRIFNTGTPWHKEDAISIMPNVKRYPYSETGILTPGKIAELRASMTPSLFAANYELQHIAAENALFSVSPKFDSAEEKLYNGIAHIDAAYGGEDGTALTLGRVDGDTLYMYGKLWQGHVKNILPQVEQICKRFRCAPIYCEINADKGYLASDMQRMGMVAKMYSENMNKYLKISTYLFKWWPNIVWIEGTDPEYLNQIMDYTEDAAHDDACLSGDTMIATIFGDKPISKIRAGEYVITPAGLRKVKWSGLTRENANVIETAGIVSTPDHKIYNAEHSEFTTADTLTCSARYSTISLKELIVWKARLLSLTGKSLSETQRADIIFAGKPRMKEERTQSNFTALCGSSTTGKSRQNITFTILMAISTITILATWTVYQLANTCRCTAKHSTKIVSIARIGESILQKLKKRLWSGIQATKVGNGTDSTPPNQSGRRAKTGLTSNALIAERLMPPFLGKNIAAKVAKKKRVAEGLDLYSNLTSEPAIVAGESTSQKTQHRNTVRLGANRGIMRKEDVYNLTIDTAGCYYANGKLVSNCDSASCIARLLDKPRRKSLI